MNKKKVWFITGASKGLGLVLAKRLLANGYAVAATSRTIDTLVAAIGKPSGDFLPLAMEITDEESVKSAIRATIDHFKSLDVVVNNAGYGQIGSLEELTDNESRKNYDVNVFGLLNVIRHTMPHLREQRTGHIFNIASVGGYTGAFAGWGIYCSTKFAVAGLTEALAEEVKEFNINVTLVYPGYFKTSFLSKESVHIPTKPLTAYTEARKSQDAHQNSINGNQPNDPEKGVQALIDMYEQKKPAVHLFLGADAYDMANKKIEVIQSALEHWKGVTLSTGFKF